ncbi:MAG: flagellar motor switch protein FliN [Candidatus Eremiobacteraeota bacterium]|nr:flagellar motor switch protein FliN [Candidatus Eremiobacteraeota bacterium]
MKDDAPNLGFLLEVPLGLCAELGRRSLRLSELLALGAGTVIDLDRRASAPIDVLVNGCVVARGEIVAVDDRYGVRITEVVGRREVP